jgi:NAD(P)-dependent dehydrogenase (short-subunit alcohol dehydrogenase family)
LILSAGINANQYAEDADGIDRHFGINWLGQFYACNLLYPLLRKTSKMADTPAPRIVFESSEMHRMAPSAVHFATLSEINNPDVGKTELYGRTKLAIILGVKYGLLERVIKPNRDSIYALSVHPGAVSFLILCISASVRITVPRSILLCNSNGQMHTPDS